MYYRSRELSPVHGKSDNYFYILSIHGHGLKQQLALGGYSSGFFHIILSMVETVLSLYPMNWQEDIAILLHF